jgi:protocatechuate 3,4-dioxygenase beta subunit
MTAYILFAEHPYYAITDSEGKYEIEDIPPGTYKVKMWHEGFQVTGTEMEKGTVKKYYFEEPYEILKTVVVPERASVTANFEFSPC